jgi:tripartite-type tricarboxylate transporter receptor subunit TctC
LLLCGRGAIEIAQRRDALGTTNGFPLALERVKVGNAAMARALLTAFLSLICTLAHAQIWPTRPVTLVVPYAAGGPVDTVGRIMAQGLSEALGQQVIVENVPGGGGMTGATRVAKAAPDGYTFLLGGSATMTLVPAINGKKTPYNPLTDFEHVIQFADSARVLITRKDFPPSTLKEFAAYAKENHDKMQFGSAGAGSGMHLCAVLLNEAIGEQITHVPYRGSALALQDLLGGRIDYLCDQISTAVQQIRGGTVKPIATMGLSRVDVLPDLPTAKEQGFDLDCASLSAFSFPKGTPEPIVRKLAQATNNAVETKFVRERLENLGVTVEPAERRAHGYYAQHLPAELEKAIAVVKAAGVSAD